MARLNPTCDLSLTVVHEIIVCKVGFDAGDGENYYNVPGSRTDDIVNIDDQSNVGQPGRFIFRIDNNTIQTIICNENGNLDVLL